MLTKLLSFFRQQQKVRTCELTNNESDLGLSLDDELESQFDSEEVPEDGSENETGSEIHPRCDWATIDSIPDSLYESLVSEVCSLGGGFPRPLTTKIRYEKGTFNGASFVASARSGELDVFVVRVPGHATREHWTPFDAYMLEREAQILGYMGRNINAPVPTLCDYSTSFDKPLSHSAYDIWLDEEYVGEGFETNFRFGDSPSPAVEQKRINFLRSLAQVMTEIGKLSFGEIGMPICPMDESVTPSIGSLYQWDYSASDGCYPRPAFTTTQDYLSARPNSLRMSVAMASNSDAQNYILGARTLLDMIFAQPVFNPEQARETFTLQHADLDLQNILVDEDGNVTGIIDWDKCLSVPRCVGAASAPFFLEKDWMPAYLNTLNTAPHLGFTTHRYRQIYAAALAEHGCADAKYTTKSAMYHAAIMALYRCDYGDVDDFIAKVLRCVPEFRGDVEETIRALGVGWPAGERILERHLKQIFKPEMPDPNVLTDADAYVAAMDWMVGFKYEFECKTEVELAKTSLRTLTE